MRLYKRQIRVVVGNDLEAVQIDNLRMEIEAVKEAQSLPAEGFVRIYNLNENTETRIRQRAERVRVFAGYDGELGLIFDGDIRRVERDRGGLVRITTITLGGNVFKLTNARVSRSYEGQVSTRQIVSDVLPTFGIDFDSLDVIPEDAVQNDFAFTGRTYDLLNKVLRPININFYEENNSISFSSVGSAPNEFEFLISQNTGMVGSPSITDEGVKVKSLLNPRLNVNRRIRVVSDVLQRAPDGDAQNAKASEQEGVYKITKVAHKGDNREGDFVTEIDAVPL